MKKIFKYPIGLAGEVVQYSLPKGSEVVAFQSQRDIPCIWAIVDTDEGRTEIRRFMIHGTGHQIKEETSYNKRYIGTCQTHNGGYVWHLFELMF
jgi:hypothetical protein